MAVAAERLDVAVSPRPRLRVVPAPVAGPTRRHARASSDRTRATAVERRRRALCVLALSAIVLVVTVAVTAALRPPAVARAVAEPPPAVVVVDEGETLWELVGPYVPAGRSRQAYVSEVVAFNDVDARALVPGTAVRLPR